MIDPKDFNERFEVPAGGYVNISQQAGGKLLFDYVPFDPTHSSVPAEFSNGAILGSLGPLTIGTGAEQAIVWSPTTHIHGFTLNDPTNDTLTIPITGMYAVNYAIIAPQHATDWTAVVIDAVGAGYQIPIPPLSVIDLSDNMYGVTLSAITLLTAGNTIVVRAEAYIHALVGATILMQIHYVGPTI